MMAKCSRYINSSRNCVVECYFGTLSVNTILVNPEAKRHVGISKKVKDSTTTNTSIIIATSTVEGNVNDTSDRISVHPVHSIRRTNRNEIVEQLHCECEMKWK